MSPKNKYHAYILCTECIRLLILAYIVCITAYVSGVGRGGLTGLELLCSINSNYQLDHRDLSIYSALYACIDRY